MKVLDYILHPKNVLNNIKQNLRVRPLNKTCCDISRWFETPIGEYQLEAEARLVRENLKNLFGYHLMELSVCKNTRFYDASRINHCFSMSPCSNLSEETVTTSDIKSGAKTTDNTPTHQGVTAFDALPFEDEQIDVTILHHVLEFSENPQQVLKEAARVTIPRGYILIVGFNPMSLDGIFKFLGRPFLNRPIWKRHGFRCRRMKDWLEFLDFSCVETRYVSYNLSINSNSYLARSGFIDRFIGSNRFPFGSSYCLLARKDKAGLTPIKPRWETAKLSPAFSVASKRAMKQAMETQVQTPIQKNALILPFRSKTKKS